MIRRQTELWYSFRFAWTSFSTKTSRRENKKKNGLRFP